MAFIHPRLPTARFHSSKTAYGSISFIQDCLRLDFRPRQRLPEFKDSPSILTSFYRPELNIKPFFNYRIITQVPIPQYRLTWLLAWITQNYYPSPDSSVPTNLAPSLAKRITQNY